MITSLRLNNFKIWQETSVPFKPLTLLAGVNGSGKSSVIQALLLLRQSVMMGTYVPGTLVLNGHYTNLGKANDVLYYEAGRGDVVEFDLHDDEITDSPFLWQNQMIENAAEDEILAGTSVFKESNPDYRRLKSAALFSSKRFQYLAAERISPRVFYGTSSRISSENDIGNAGEFAPHYLLNNGHRQKVQFENMRHPNALNHSLVEQTTAWLQEISANIRIETSDLGNQVSLKYSFTTEGVATTPAFKPINVAFGVSYVLPVLVALLKANVGDLVIIENPESHLHPHAQSLLGRLAARLAHNGVQVIIETHSDHVLNGVRIAVKEFSEGNIGIAAKDVSILYAIKDKHKHSAHLLTVPVGEDGSIEEWHDGFFDQANKDLQTLFGF
jgi:predicted ATPase